MEYLQAALRFSEFAVEFVAFTPRLRIFFVLAAITLVWARWKQRPFRKRLWKPYHWLVITHLLFFPAAIALGVIGANPVTNPTIPHHGNATAWVCQDLLYYGSLASCAFWIWRTKGFRWYASSLMGLLELPTLGALAIAGMSIAGDWP
jgi:hypothetical protein